MSSHEWHDGGGELDKEVDAGPRVRTFRRSADRLEILAIPLQLGYRSILFVRWVAGASVYVTHARARPPGRCIARDASGAGDQECTAASSIYPAGPNGTGSMRFIAPEKDCNGAARIDGDDGWSGKERGERRGRKGRDR